MVSKFSLLSNLLLASVALAAPSWLEARLAHRRENPQLKAINRVESPASTVSTPGAGVVVEEGNITTVTGTFTVPTPDPSISGFAAVLVGIDGGICGNVIFLTGVVFEVTSEGATGYAAAYGWNPGPISYFSGISISAGDHITATVNASSTTSGTAVIENLTTGQTVKEELTSSYALCEQTMAADWLVYQPDDSPLLLDFGTVTFSNATASGPSGTIYTPSSGTTVNIEQNGTVFTSVTTSGSTVTIKYV